MKFIFKLVFVVSAVIVVLTGCEATDDSFLQVRTVVLPVEADDSVGSYWIDGDVVYYSVNPSVGELEINEAAEFTSDMNTKIYQYDNLRGEKSLLYQYDVGWQVDVNDMGLCGDILYWDDNVNKDGFQVVGYDLKENKFLGTIFSFEDIGDENLVITPETDGEKIYFSAIDEGGIYVYEYRDGVVSKINEEIYLSSAYEHLDSYNGTYVVAVQGDDGYQIAEMTKDGRINPVDSLSYEYVSLLQINEKYVSFLSDESRDEITVINRKSKQTTSFEVGSFFNYGLLDNYIIINCNDHFRIINLESGEDYEEAHIEDGFYLWLFDRGEMCTSLNDNEILIFRNCSE